MTKILVIEDDPVIARLYGSKYSSAGFATLIAADGEEGLRLLDSFKPDLVHLDLMVPKVNGVDIVKEIRSRPELARLPVVVLSNTYQNQHVKAVMSAGATELVSKATCTPKMMLDIVEKYRHRTTPTRAPRRASGGGKAEPQGAESATGAHSGTREFEAAMARQAASQDRIRKDFLARASRMLDRIAARVQPLLEAKDAATRLLELREIAGHVQTLGFHAGVAGLESAARFSQALAALLGDVIEKPDAFTDSVLRTIVDACDQLPGFFAATEAQDDPHPDLPPQVLVVDGDEANRRECALALARIDAATLRLGDPQTALAVLEENPFSLILLDVVLPGMEGFDVCRRVRACAANRSTPVVFMTALEGLESRDKAVASGGNDLIAKPFLPMELAVKALTLLRREHPEFPKAASPAAV